MSECDGVAKHNKINFQIDETAQTDTDKVKCDSLQYCCDPRYGEDDKIPLQLINVEKNHEILLKHETGGMYAW
jgi:hypothetical protein